MRKQAAFPAALQYENPVMRARCFDQAHGEDGEIRRRVEFLLRTNAEANLLPQQIPGSLCETMVIDVIDDEDLDATSETLHDPLSPDQQIGPFRLIKMIGEGGMGSVWEAEQSAPVRRRVALKVIKSDMDSEDMIARFESERQALAVMDHPNVVQILDAGTTETGRPFIAMELVRGIPITQYCNEQKLTLDERVAMMIPVCQAIQHAHQNGILHSDIKPSNILVSTCNGRQVPIVIDFGLATTIGPSMTATAPMTDCGRIIGTLEYMSPEQADLSGCNLDARSDVYSLGIVLYELLTGTTPVTRKRTQNSAIMELLRLIREEEPPSPSIQISASSHQCALISHQRRLEPDRLDGVMRRELDGIVMRAVHKTREQRFASPAELGLDLQRYLSGGRVHACPSPRASWLRTFIRRRQAAVAVTITAMMMIAMAVRFCHSEFARVTGRAAFSGEILAKQKQRAVTRSQDEPGQVMPFDERPKSGSSSRQTAPVSRELSEARVDAQFKTCRRTVSLCSADNSEVADRFS